MARARNPRPRKPQKSRPPSAARLRPLLAPRGRARSARRPQRRRSRRSRRDRSADGTISVIIAKTADDNAKTDNEVENWIMRINAKGLHWTAVTLADGTKKTYWYAWRGGPRLDRRLWLARVHRQFQRRHRHQGRAPEGRLLSLLQGYQQSQDFSPCASAPAPTTSSRSSRSSRNSATPRSRRWPIRARAASSWTGATSWRCARSGKPIMRGRCSPACCHGRRTAARSRSTPASAAGGSITAPASIPCGASRTRPPSSNMPRRIYLAAAARAVDRPAPGRSPAAAVVGL